MRTNVSILLILTLSLSYCTKSDDNSKKIKLLRVLHYSSSTSANPTDGVEYEYDVTGNLYKESFYSYRPTTALFRYREHQYSGNQKIKINVFDEEEGDFILSCYFDFFYDGNRLIKEEYRRFDGSLIISHNYEYKDGNLIREYNYDSDSEIYEETKYTYDNQSRLMLEENSASDVDDYKYTKYTYDNSGRVIKLEYYNINWDLLKYVEKTYNGRSKLPVKDLHYDKWGNQTLQYQHHYDKWGNLTETILTDYCSLFKRKYNGELLIEEIHYRDPFKKDGCTENGMSRYEYE